MEKKGSAGKIRIAMIGAGQMANLVHYPSLHSFEDVEIVAVCDIDENSRERTARKYGISGQYSDYRQMIEDTAPDAVYAIGQPHIMYDIWVWCLQQGLHLFIEKPLGLNIHQARSLTLLAERHECITQVAFNRRSAPMIRFLRDECLKRGPITYSLCRFYKSEIHPNVAARDHMLDETIHAIDTVRWINGGKIVAVDSVSRRIHVPDLNFFLATLHFDNGSVGTVIHNRSSGRRVLSVEMHAPNIYVDAEIENKAYLYADGDYAGIEFDTKEYAGSDEFHVYTGFQAKSREFIDCVRAGKQPGSHFADALKTMEAAEIILAQSLLQGR